MSNYSDYLKSTISSKLFNVGYELESVHIVQTPISFIDHRSECDPMIDLCGRRVFPVIVSPMGSVTDENNYKVWLDNGFICVIPRTVDFEKRIEISKETFASFSLSEAEGLSVGDLFDDGTKHYVCIDIAHGTMNRLYATCVMLKRRFKENIVIMTGNVATPEAYPYYAKNYIDYMRACIGTGSRCVVEGTMIEMADGSKEPIEDILPGDSVKTSNGNRKVLNVFKKNARSTIVVNGEIECTSDHKFFVVRKEDSDKIKTDEDIIKYGFYFEADKLTNDYLLVQG